MLAEADRAVAREFQRRLAEIVELHDLRVFGSRARGDATWESDLDLFIEVETITPELREQIYEFAWEVGFEMDRIISPIIIGRDQLEHGPMAASPLVLNVRREGVRP